MWVTLHPGCCKTLSLLPELNSRGLLERHSREGITLEEVT